MTVNELLKSGKLTKKGALRLIESLLEGEAQVDVNEEGTIYYCYGSSPQSYAKAEDVAPIETIADLVGELEEGYNSLPPYENLKLIAEILEISLPSIS